MGSSSPSTDEDVVAAAVAIVEFGTKNSETRSELGETYVAAKSYLRKLFKAAEEGDC